MRFWRKRAIWPEKSRKNTVWLIRHANLLIRKLEEGTRYLLIANGAVLVAIVGGAGASWQQPQLQHLFTRVITLVAPFGLPFAMFAWMFSVPLIQNLLALREDVEEHGHTPETWRRWVVFREISWIFFGFAAISVLAIVVAASKASEALKSVPPPPPVSSYSYDRPTYHNAQYAAFVTIFPQSCASRRGRRSAGGRYDCLDASHATRAAANL